MVTKNGKQEQINAAALVLGTGISVLLGIGLTGILAWLTINGRIGEQQAAKIVFVILAITSFAGGWSGWILNKRKFMYMPLVVSVLYACVLLVCGLLLFDGMLQNLWLTIIVVALGGATAWLLGRKGTQTGGRRKRRHR